MRGKPSSDRKVDAAISRSVNFELTIADLARRGEQRAWYVAFASMAMALILAGGYFYMLPLKQKVPYLVMADAYTGTATVARLDGDFAMRGITTREAVNRSNVAHFVLARESYDQSLVNLHDWKTVQTMASSSVKSEYMAMFSSTNPDSWVKQYGPYQSIRIKLLSIQLVGGGRGKTPRGATVRFQRSLFNKSNGSTRAMDNKIATIEFTYEQNLEMDDQNRIENPLGFWVTSYRVDDDYATAPPAEIPAPPVTPATDPRADAVPARAATTAVSMSASTLPTDPAGVARQ